MVWRVQCDLHGSGDQGHIPQETNWTNYSQTPAEDEAATAMVRGQPSKTVNQETAL